MLNEAIQRARKLVIDKKPDLEIEQVEERAKSIGGAVRYADLSQDRTLDYVFLGQITAMQGNTAPYLQYAVARIIAFSEGKNRAAKIKPHITQH